MKPRFERESRLAMNNIGSEPVEDGHIDQEKQIPPTMQTTTVSSNDTTCTGRKRRGWPGGRHATPTELKMRSVIIAISVNFATYPANRNLRATAKSMRPRAKSFIRSISQINYNRQKFSLSMTSEVRKCPKSAKSDRFPGFLHLAIERHRIFFCNV